VRPSIREELNHVLSNESKLKPSQKYGFALIYVPSLIVLIMVLFFAYAPRAGVATVVRLRVEICQWDVYRSSKGKRRVTKVYHPCEGADQVTRYRLKSNEERVFQGSVGFGPLARLSERNRFEPQVVLFPDTLNGSQVRVGDTFEVEYRFFASRPAVISKVLRRKD
jgi:hypothetical protein